MLIVISLMCSVVGCCFSALHPSELEEFYELCFEYLSSGPTPYKEVCKVCKVRDEMCLCSQMKQKEGWCSRAPSHRMFWWFHSPIWPSCCLCLLSPPSFHLQCIDRHGQQFLGLVRMRYMVLSYAKSLAAIMSIVPLPSSRYLMSDNRKEMPSSGESTRSCGEGHETMRAKRVKRVGGVDERLPPLAPVSDPSMTSAPQPIWDMIPRHDIPVGQRPPPPPPPPEEEDKKEEVVMVVEEAFEGWDGGVEDKGLDYIDVLPDLGLLDGLVV